MSTAKMYAKQHRQLGCPGCRFADLKALYKRSCCTFPTNIRIDINRTENQCLCRNIGEAAGQSAVGPAHSTTEVQP